MKVLGIPLLYLGIFFAGFLTPIILQISVKILSWINTEATEFMTKKRKRREELREKRRKEEEEEREKRRLKVVEEEKELCKKGIHGTGKLRNIFWVKIYFSNTWLTDWVAICEKCNKLVLRKSFPRKEEKNGMTAREIRKVLRQYKGFVSRTFEEYNKENEGLKTNKEYQRMRNKYLERMDILIPHCDKDWLEENGIEYEEEKNSTDIEKEREDMNLEEELDGY